MSTHRISWNEIRQIIIIIIIISTETFTSYDITNQRLFMTCEVVIYVKTGLARRSTDELVDNHRHDNDYD